MTTLAHLPDDHVVYVPGVGEVAIGTIRGTATEQEPAVDGEWAATLSMYADLATRNLERDPWDSGATQSEIRAYHVSRYTSGATPPASM